MEKQTPTKNKEEYRSLAEKIVESLTLRKGLKVISGCVKDFALSFDDVVSSAYRAPTNIRRFLNKQNYLLRNKESIEEDVRMGAMFGFVCGITPYMFLGLCGVAHLFVGESGQNDFINNVSMIFTGTNLTSLVYETGRFRQSRGERQTVLNTMKKSKEKEIEKGRYNLYNVEKINSDIPERSLYLIKESKPNWSPISLDGRETILDSSRKILSERYYWIRKVPSKKKKRAGRNKNV